MSKDEKDKTAKEQVDQDRFVDQIKKEIEDLAEHNSIEEQEGFFDEPQAPKDSRRYRAKPGEEFKFEQSDVLMQQQAKEIFDKHQAFEKKLREEEGSDQDEPLKEYTEAEKKELQESIAQKAKQAEETAYTDTTYVPPESYLPLYEAEYEKEVKSTVTIRGNCDYEGILEDPNNFVDNSDEDIPSDLDTLDWKEPSFRPTEQGKMTCPDGTRYEGEWRKGFFEGEGKLTKPGYEYVGGFLKEKRHGFGKWFYKSTSDEGTGYCYYVGGFRNGKANGYGKEVCAEEEHYVDMKSLKKSLGDGNTRDMHYHFGFYKDELITGMSRTHWENDERVFIDREDDMRQGYALMIFADSGSQIQRWRKGNPHGVTVQKSINETYAKTRFDEGVDIGKGHEGWTDIEDWPSYEDKYEELEKHFAEIEKKVNQKMKKYRKPVPKKTKADLHNEKVIQEMNDQGYS